MFDQDHTAHHAHWLTGMVHSIDPHHGFVFPVRGIIGDFNAIDGQSHFGADADFNNFSDIRIRRMPQIQQIVDIFITLVIRDISR